MLRNLSLVATFLVGVIFGCVLGSHTGSVVAQSDSTAATATLDDVVDQLKKLNDTSKDTNALLHSNTLRVVTVINPPR